MSAILPGVSAKLCDLVQFLKLSGACQPRVRPVFGTRATILRRVDSVGAKCGSSMPNPARLVEKLSVHRIFLAAPLEPRPSTFGEFEMAAESGAGEPFGGFQNMQ